MKETISYCDICKKEINHTSLPKFEAQTKGEESFEITSFKIRGYISVSSVSEPYQWQELEDVCKDCVKKIINDTL